MKKLALLFVNCSLFASLNAMSFDEEIADNTPPAHLQVAPPSSRSSQEGDSSSLVSLGNRDYLTENDSLKRSSLSSYEKPESLDSALGTLRETKLDQLHRQLISVQSVGTMIDILNKNTDLISCYKELQSDAVFATRRLFQSMNNQQRKQMKTLMAGMRTVVELDDDAVCCEPMQKRKKMNPVIIDDSASVEDIERILMEKSNMADKALTSSIMSRLLALKKDADDQAVIDKLCALICKASLRWMRCQKMPAEDKIVLMQKYVTVLSKDYIAYDEYLFLLDEILLNLPKDSKSISTIKKRARDAYAKMQDESYQISFPRLFPTSFLHRLRYGW